MNNEIEEMSFSDQKKPKIEKSISISVHIDFIKRIERKKGWKLNPNEAYIDKENENVEFSYSDIKHTIEYDAIREYQRQLRSFYNNDSIKVIHDSTNKGSIEVIMTIIGFFNDIVEFLEGTKKVKDFTKNIFSSKLNNQYGDYFKIKTELINDPNRLTFKDRLDRFLWFCAGAKISYINECPTDHVKYAGIGATVFITGILAFLSGGYAFYTVFNDIYLSVSFAIIWAITIFSLDRYIVSSMKKDGILRNELLTALPRFFIAIVISFVVSNPLELRLFEKEINLQLKVDKSKFEKEQTANSKSTRDIEEVKSEVNIIKTKIKEREDKVLLLRDSLTAEIQGRIGSGKFGDGPAAKSLRENISNTQLEIQSFNIELTQKQNKIDSLSQTRKNEVDTLLKSHEKTDGFLARNIAFSNLRQAPENSFAKYAFYLLALLILLLETAPIIVKIISKKGAYDVLIDKIEKEKLEVLVSQLKDKIIKMTLDYERIQRIQLDSFDELQAKSTNILIGDTINQKVINYLRNEHLLLQKILSKKYRTFVSEG